MKDYLRKVSDFETIKYEVEKYILENKNTVTFRDVFDYLIDKYDSDDKENYDVVTALYVLYLHT
jgi:hypothetical protein